MPATRLAAEERLQPQSLTRLIAGLEYTGAIKRSRSATDRRERTIAITPRGRRVLAAEIRARRTWLAQAIRATLTPAEHATLLAAADAMVKLTSHAEPAAPLARRRRRC